MELKPKVAVLSEKIPLALRLREVRITFERTERKRQAQLDTNLGQKIKPARHSASKLLVNIVPKPPNESFEGPLQHYFSSSQRFAEGWLLKRRIWIKPTRSLKTINRQRHGPACLYRIAICTQAILDRRAEASISKRLFRDQLWFHKCKTVRFLFCRGSMWTIFLRC